MKAIQKSSNRYPIRNATGAWGVATWLLLSLAAPAQRARAPLPAKPGAEAEPSQAPRKPGNEGVRVHGHWVIVVRNPDGTLVTRREFENSLVTDEAEASGDQYLTGLLSGNLVPSDPGVAFISYTDATVEAANPPSSKSCPIYAEVGVSGVSCHVLTTAQSILHNYSDAVGVSRVSQAAGFADIANGLGLSTQFSAPVGWVLSGNYTVPAAMTNVWAVQTLAAFCVSSTTFLTQTRSNNVLVGTTGDLSTAVGAQKCVAASITPYVGDAYPVFATLTSTLVAGGPIAVTPGQAITVTVTISFS